MGRYDLWPYNDFLGQLTRIQESLAAKYRWCNDEADIATSIYYWIIIHRATATFCANHIPHIAGLSLDSTNSILEVTYVCLSSIGNLIDTTTGLAYYIVVPSGGSNWQ